jgi:hypothetical protein
MYDSGKGRWFAPDPARQYWSPYVGMGNNPVSLVDPDVRCTWRNSSGETKYFEAGTDPGSDWTYVGSDFQYADINVSPQYTAHERTMMNPIVNNIHAGTNQASIYIAPILLGVGSFGTASTAVSIAKRAAFMYRMYSRAEAGKGVTNGLNKTISVQKQARHIAGTAKPGGGFLNSVDDAQSVLNAVHSGKATFLGTSKVGHQVYRFNGVTGTNVNVGAGITGQPTNVFMIKGTTSPSVVPTSPLWKP